jgi:hypothetical protein
MYIDLAAWVAGVNGLTAPVMLRGIKPHTALSCLLSDTEIAERQHADGFFARPTECA